MSGTSLTDTSGERGMIKVMGMVIFSLILLSLFIVSMARLLGSGRDDSDSDPVMRNALVGRIEPVGAVRTSAEELEQVASAETAGGASGRSGEELVQGVCAGCHAAAVGGAPLLDDAEAWAERREAGLDTLVASVVNGKGSMPARGGSDYSDEDIRLAVQHIAMFEDTDDAAPAEETVDASAEQAAPAEATEETTEASGEQAAPAEETAEASGGQAAPAEAAVEETAMAATAEGTTDAAAVTTRDVAGAESELAEAAVAEDVGTAAPGAEMPSAELVALIGSGAEPAGLTDDIKAQVNGVCAGCHIAGVANAPKIGDKAAWAERAELGLVALTQSVIDGKGVMPARGGSTLTDEQIPIAIQYQMGKTGP